MEERIMRDVTEGMLCPSSGRPGWSARISALAGNRGVYGLVSLLLLLPVYWQPRVQAGDLSSHIYNAWLAHLIETGKAQGLVVVTQTTNVLFDLILSAFEQSPLYKAYLSYGVGLMSGTKDSELCPEEFEALADFRASLNKYA